MVTLYPAILALFAYSKRKKPSYLAVPVFFLFTVSRKKLHVGMELETRKCWVFVVAVLFKESPVCPFYSRN